MGTGSLSRC